MSKFPNSDMRANLSTLIANFVYRRDLASKQLEAAESPTDYLIDTSKIARRGVRTYSPESFPIPPPSRRSASSQNSATTILEFSVPSKHKRPEMCKVIEKDGTTGYLMDDLDALLKLHGFKIQSAFVKW